MIPLYTDSDGNGPHPGNSFQLANLSQPWPRVRFLVDLPRANTETAAGLCHFLNFQSCSFLARSWFIAYRYLVLPAGRLLLVSEDSDIEPLPEGVCPPSCCQSTGPRWTSPGFGKHNPHHEHHRYLARDQLHLEHDDDDAAATPFCSWIKTSGYWREDKVLPAPDMAWGQTNFEWTGLVCTPGTHRWWPPPPPPGQNLSFCFCEVGESWWKIAFQCGAYLTVDGVCWVWNSGKASLTLFWQHLLTDIANVLQQSWVGIISKCNAYFTGLLYRESLTWCSRW